MYFQTDAAFPQLVQRKGCYLFALLRACEIVAEATFTIDGALEIIDAGFLRGWLSKIDCSVLNPDRICREGLALLGAPGRSIVQVGIQDANGKQTWWGWARGNPAYHEVGFLALKFRTPNGWHFCLGDPSGAVLFDPYGKPYQRGELIEALIHHVEREA